MQTGVSLDQRLRCQRQSHQTQANLDQDALYCRLADLHMTKILDQGICHMCDVAMYAPKSQKLRVDVLRQSLVESVMALRSLPPASLCFRL